MRIPGKSIRVPKIIVDEQCVVRLEVDAIVPEFEPREPLLEPAVLRFLDELQSLANQGEIEALARHGTVYVRRSA